MSKLVDILTFEEAAELLRIIDDAPRGGELNIQLGEASLQLKLKDPAGAPASVQAASQGVAPPATKPAEPEAAQEVQEVPPTKAPAAPGKALDEEAARAQGLVSVESPMAGIFYRGPAPDKPPFVEVGDKVEEGQQVGIIEVMKLMNRIVAPCTGVVKEIGLANEELAEFGAALMWIEPDETGA